MRVGQNSERARHRQIAVFGFSSARQVINKQAIRADREGQRNGCTFAGIEKCKGWIGRRVFVNFAPGRRLSHTVAHRFGRISVL